MEEMVFPLTFYLIFNLSNFSNQLITGLTDIFTGKND